MAFWNTLNTWLGSNVITDPVSAERAANAIAAKPTLADQNISAESFTASQENINSSFIQNTASTNKVISTVVNEIYKDKAKEIQDALASLPTNDLDRFVNYTYHIRFWLTSSDLVDQIGTGLAQSNIKASIDAIPKVVIAESGVTAGFNIRELRFNNLVGTTREARNMPQITWSMTITEPYGLSLPDRINSAAQEYGMLNWQRAKYFVQLWFCGYDENGNVVENGLHHKVFRVVITSMSLTGSEQGSQYDIKGICDGTYGFTNEASMQAATIAISSNSVAGFFNGLQQSLNRLESSKDPGAKNLVEYQFVVPKELQSWVLDTNKLLENDARNNPFNKSKDGSNSQTITMPPGTDVGNAVLFALSKSQDVQNWSMGTSDSGTASNFQEHGLLRNIKIHSQVDYTDFDLLTGDYIKKITYTLVPYEETRVRTDIDKIRHAEQADVQQNKLLYLLRQKRINRKYNWIFTGQNLDILKFDLKINNFWAIAVPPYDGNNHYSNQTQGALAGTNQSAWVDHQNLLSSSLARLNDLKVLKKKQQTELDTWKNDSTPANIISALSAGGTIPNYTATEKYLQDKSSLLQSQISTTDAQLAAAQTEAAQLRSDFIVNINDPTMAMQRNNPLAANIVNGRLALRSTFQAKGAIYAEDQTILPMTSNFPIVVKPMAEANPALANQASASEKQQAAPSGENLPTSRTLWGAFQGNFDSFNKEYQNISLEIRGDPWWMGYDNIQQNTLISQLVKSTANADPKTYADYYGGDHLFYLNYRSGEILNEDTGFMTFSNGSQTVSGFYQVIEVSNIFSNGAFTQILKSIKDVMSQNASNKVAPPPASKPPSKPPSKPVVEIPNPVDIMSTGLQGII